jgi:hypothetical protein
MMRDVAPHVDVERAVFVFLDEVNRRVIDLRVAATLAWFLLAAALNTGGGAVQAVNARLLFRPNVPFAEVAGRIASLLQQLGNRHAVAEAAVGRILCERGRELRGHEARAAGTAGDARGVALEEARAVARELVEVRRLGIRMAVAMPRYVAEAKRLKRLHLSRIGRPEISFVNRGAETAPKKGIGRLKHTSLGWPDAGVHAASRVQGRGPSSLACFAVLLHNAGIAGDLTAHGRPG